VPRSEPEPVARRHGDDDYVGDEAKTDRASPPRRQSPELHIDTSPARREPPPTSIDEQATPRQQHEPLVANEPLRAAAAPAPTETRSGLIAAEARSSTPTANVEQRDATAVPAVTVHIGRVDVRAVVAAPASPTTDESPAAPLLAGPDLSDYLAREGRGS
jgi:hypothetical protein